MSKRPTSLKEIPCYCCDCQKQCDKRVRVDPRMSAQRDKMYNNASLSYESCILRIVLKMNKEGGEG